MRGDGYWGVMVSHLRGVSVHGEGPHCKLSHQSRDSICQTVGFGAVGCSGIEVVMELLEAAADGDVAEVRWLVAQGVDVNVEDGNGARPLHWAAAHGHMELVTTLAELGADVHAAASVGQRPLHAAAFNGHVEVATTLVELGADVNVENAAGQRPLHLAVANGHVEVARTLVALGADVNAEDADGARPLHHAAGNGQVEVLNTLVLLGADVHAAAADGGRPLHDAALGGHVEVLKTFAELGADMHAVTTRGNTALHVARNTEAVVWLLQAGAQLNRRNTVGDTPLFQAIHRGHVPAVTALMQAGACPYASDSVWWTRLIVDAVMGDEEALTELVAASPELTRRLNQNGHFARTAVQLAELSIHRQREQLRSALTAAPP
jgi:ankyrin repeat protein